MSSEASDTINRAMSYSAAYRAVVEEERIRQAGKEKMTRTTRDLAAAARTEYEARLRAALDAIKQQTQAELREARRARLDAATERGKSAAAAVATGWLDLSSRILREYQDDLTPRYQDQGVQAQADSSALVKAPSTPEREKQDTSPTAKRARTSSPTITTTWRPRGTKRRISLDDDEDEDEDENTPAPPSSSAVTLSTGDIHEELPARRAAPDHHHPYARVPASRFRPLLSASAVRRGIQARARARNQARAPGRPAVEQPPRDGEPALELRCQGVLPSL
ncbi:hypothetical protein F4775DRAFT_101366 [Biscogniauxia sp. FL1348]|nr:hypothetical protein F4775DRAFT_101366 [Biscogniauxia sp. FL1348]